LKGTPTSKKYTYAGIAQVGKKTKAHFTNRRIEHAKRLEASGASLTAFVELPRPMTKLDAVRHLETLPNPEFRTTGAKNAFADVVERFSKQ
jgi:hypothetical protein